jgi:WD40 repeat protein
MGRYDRDTNTGFASVWDYRNRREIVALRGHSSAVTCMAFNPDGRRLATSADQTVSIWDLDTGKELFTFRGHRAPVTALAFRFDGNRLASGGNDATVRIWDVSPDDERSD